MTHALALRQGQMVGPMDWATMREQAQWLVKSGFLPGSIKTPEQAIAIMLQGRELDIPPMAALQTINVIQGKPTVSPQLMLALIERSRQAKQIEIPEETDTACTVVMQRIGRTPHSERFTIEATPPPALTVSFEPQGGSGGGDFRLTSGNVVYRVTVDALRGRVRSGRL